MTANQKYRLEVGFLFGLAAVVAIVEAIVFLAPVAFAIRRAW